MKNLPVSEGLFNSQQRLPERWFDRAQGKIVPRDARHDDDIAGRREQGPVKAIGLSKDTSDAVAAHGASEPSPNRETEPRISEVVRRRPDNHLGETEDVTAAKYAIEVAFSAKTLSSQETLLHNSSRQDLDTVESGARTVRSCDCRPTVSLTAVPVHVIIAASADSAQDLHAHQEPLYNYGPDVSQRNMAPK